MDSWMKAILTLAVAAVSLHILHSGKPNDERAREAAMWLLGALMGYWFR
jgi:hypothetical protein